MITSVFRFAYRMVRPHPVPLCIMISVAILWAIDVSLRPYLLKIILNRLADSGTVNPYLLLLGPIAAYMAMWFIMSSFFRLYDYFVAYRMIPELRKQISTTCLHQLLQQSHQFYQNNFAGSLGSKVSELVMAIPDLVQICIDRFLSNFLSLSFATFTLWLVNPRFAIVMLTWAGLFLVGSLLAKNRLTILAADWSFKGHLITGRIVDALSNMLTVRLFARRQSEDALLESTIDQALQAERAMEWAYFKLWMLYGYAFVIAKGINFYFLLQGRAEGWVTVGDFALVLGINVGIVDLLWNLTKEYSKFTKLQGRVEQGLRDVMVEPGIMDTPQAKDLVVIHGKIAFDHVKFHYAGTEPLFQDKSVVILPGQKVGLVGYSGSGKTTFVHLILRLYDITGGRILIDDQDIRQVTQDSLHANIAMIPQDPSLFHRSLMENIRYGKADAPDADVIQAAQKAHAHTFIQSLPQKYNSLVGERGVKLSGGQRQRIAIARAILKNAPILILDEATSQLDSLTEADIQESLWPLMQGKTTLVVAHRLSTLMHMDRILVFNKGHIVEDGSHAALLAKGGLYKTLWEAQVSGFLPD